MTRLVLPVCSRMEEDFDFLSSLQTTLFCLRCVGTWPSNTYKLDAYTLYATASITICLFGHNFFQTVNIFFIFNDLNTLTGVIFVALTCLVAILKSLLFIFNMRRLKKLLLVDIRQKLFKPRNRQQVVMVQSRVNFWKKIYFMFTGMGVATMFFWALFPIMDGTVKEHRLPFLAWYPFSVNKSPFYEITYIYQIVSVFFIVIVNMNSDMLLVALMNILGVQCDLLCDNLKNIQFRERINEEFLRCVNHHMQILSYASDCNKFFNTIVLAQFFTTVVSLGLTMYQLTIVTPFTSEFYSFIVYGGAVLMEIFLYCWFGNESLNIPFASFGFDWTIGSVGLQKNLIIFIAKSQRPIRMSALNLFHLSLETFVKILRTAYSYFALLNNVNSLN
ncbi:odorant receptor Or1 isoform X2 [Tribolium castaneum]|uniref:odorant receptor Or1 isoform X2 n=1 Tax=Tribolium castaneum TaxID=7070 RepID=UPI00077DB420|nr:PREDICTED: odorant receptor Or1 isoform X2 [Tribolium castaneum]|eukprot:XP_015838678.1 PREDICTED: odorant receptor Or1 isoform X2 [Tribolium castaneum]